MRLKTFALVLAHVCPSMAAKDTKRQVVGFALICHLVWRGVSGDGSQQAHVEQPRVVQERLAPEADRQASVVEHHHDVLLECAVLALSNAVLLRQASDGVFAPNAVFCKELVPDVANVLSAFVLVEAEDEEIVLFLDHGFECLKHLECVQLVLQEVDPPVARPVIDEHHPVAIARCSCSGHHVQIGVDALKHARSAVGCLGRKGIGVVFPNNTWLTVNKKRRVAVEVQPGRELLILWYLMTLDSPMYLCSDVFDGLVVSHVVSLSSCTKCHVALIM
jgi:hypothetical protein